MILTEDIVRDEIVNRMNKSLLFDLFGLDDYLFFAGTPYVTLEEWSKFSKNEKVKLPFIWMNTVATRDTNGSYKEPFFRKSSVEILFIHWSNWKGKNQERLENSIEPLMRLQNEFIRVVDENRRVFQTSNRVALKSFPRFGKESDKGIESTLFNSTLSAVRMNLELTINKYKTCKL